MQHAHTGKLATPMIFLACQKFIICMTFVPAEQILLKITASHFNALNMQIANQNVLERNLIAMHNKNKAMLKTLKILIHF